MEKDVVIIGAGLTGLTVALLLKNRGLSVAILEKSNRVGGQIQTFHENGFVFESGPNTGASASEEVINLFNVLQPDCEIEFARKESESRWIWKNGQFHPLPNGLWSGIITPLFTISDKLRILGEPFRKKGKNPDESIAALGARRLGKSFVNYAIDPFLSGVYAGDAETLITRHALPKLYSLEQTYGSFIGGSIKKSCENKRDSRSKTPKGIFSVKGGMENLPKAMQKHIGTENLFLSATGTFVSQNSKNRAWQIECTQNGKELNFTCRHVITTVGAYALPPLLPFIPYNEIEKISNLRYAPIVQVAVGVKEREELTFSAFGGLVSSKDKEDFLGILFPFSCFDKRCPENGALFSFFMGGTKRVDLTQLSDTEIEEKTVKAFHRMLKFPENKMPDLIKIFRHPNAIPQYEISSEERLKTISELEKKFPGLHIAGNLRDGVGMAHRIIQGTKLANEINQKSHIL